MLTYKLYSCFSSIYWSPPKKNMGKSLPTFMAHGLKLPQFARCTEDQNRSNQRGQSPLIAAASFGQREVVLRLLQAVWSMPCQTTKHGWLFESCMIVWKVDNWWSLILIVSGELITWVIHGNNFCISLKLIMLCMFLFFQSLGPWCLQNLWSWLMTVLTEGSRRSSPRDLHGPHGVACGRRRWAPGGAAVLVGVAGRDSVRGIDAVTSSCCFFVISVTLGFHTFYIFQYLPVVFHTFYSLWLTFLWPEPVARPFGWWVLVC